MDQELDKRLREIEDQLGAVALEVGGDIDFLPIRNELEDAEERLAGFIRENSETLAVRIESVSEAVRRLHERVDEIAGTVEAIQTELPD